MSILEQVKREYATLSLELERNPTYKKLRALEAVLAAYGESSVGSNGSPKTPAAVNGSSHARTTAGGGMKGAALNAAAEFIRQNGNSADYNSLLAHVTSKVPEISKKRLSIYMSASPLFKFNKDDKRWQL